MARGAPPRNAEAPRAAPAGRRRSNGESAATRAAARLATCEGADAEMAALLGMEGARAPKCKDNVPLTVFLLELAADAQRKVEEGQSDKWLFVVRRAIAEVSKLPQAIRSAQQAKQVKYIGDVLAKRIGMFFELCPRPTFLDADDGAAAAAAAPVEAAAAPKKRGRPPKESAQAAETVDLLSSQSPSPVKKPRHSLPSPKFAAVTTDAAPPATAAAAAPDAARPPTKVKGDRGYHDPSKAPKARTAAFTFLCVLYRDVHLPSKNDWGTHERIPHHTKQSLMDAAEASGISNHPIRGQGASLPASFGGQGHAGGVRAGPAHYDGWSSWRTLINSNPPLCHEWSNPKRVRLTEEGEVVARLCYRRALAMSLVLVPDTDDGVVVATGEEPLDSLRVPAPVLASSGSSPERQRDANPCHSKLLHQLTTSRAQLSGKENAVALSDDVIDLTNSPDKPPAPCAASVRSMKTAASLATKQADVVLPHSDPGPSQEPAASQQVGALIRPENTLRVKFNYGETRMMRSVALPANATTFSAVYDIALVLDARERYNGAMAPGASAPIHERANQLRSSGTRVFVKTLPIGDATWIALPKGAVTAAETATLSLQQVLERRGLTEDDVQLLDAVLERKSFVDLVGSLTSGRYERQKHYLSRCGLRRPIYLVEGSLGAGGSGGAGNFGALSLAQTKQAKMATVETDFGDGIVVVRTESVMDTLRYLNAITQVLSSEYDALCAVTLPAEDASASAGPSTSTHETALLSATHPPTLGAFVAHVSSQQKEHTSSLGFAWLRMLCQVPRVGLETAEAVAAKYPTPNALLAHYDGIVYGSAADSTLTPSQRRIQASLSLSSLVVGRKGARTVGGAASKSIYDHIWADA